VIRKDNCALTQRVQQGALITLFKTSSKQKLKEYLQRQWTKIMSGSLPLSQFVLSGRVREQYRTGGTTLQAELVKNLCSIDPGFKMKASERISYVIVATPGQAFRLKDCVRTPMQLLENWDRESIHTAYYASTQLNRALARCFSLPPYNINIHAWFASTPKPRKRANFWPVKKEKNISNFFGSGTCAHCAEKCPSNGSSKVVVCTRCLAGSERQVGAVWALNRHNKSLKMREGLRKICENCNGLRGAGDELGFGADAGEGKGVVVPIGNCLNLECAVFFKRHRVREMEIESEAVVKAFGLLDVDEYDEFGL